jgi:hypothetical protein
LAEESPWEYDAFVSYTRFDESLKRFMTDFTATMRRTFRGLTGRDMRLFVDVQEIRAAVLWEARLLSALNRSAILIAVISPSYFTSEWCAREWDMFLALEEERRRQYSLLPYESVVFPVLLTESGTLLSTGADVQRRVQEAAARQTVDLANTDPEGPDFGAKIARLAGDAVATIAKLSRPGGTPADTRTFATTTPLVTVRQGIDLGRYAELLADARSVIIVDSTGEGLPESLEQAIGRKRERGGPRAFWDHLRVVFLGDELLPYVSDDLSAAYPNHAEAVRERMTRAARARREVTSLLLRQGVPGRWTLYSYPHLLPLTGTLFVMEDLKRMVEVALPCPAQSVQDSLYLGFLDRVDPSFEATFQQVVAGSREENEIVLFGVPATEGFRCQGAKFRRSVLVEGQGMGDWLAVVISILWREGQNGPEPLLQINTPHTSTRELGKISHVSGYVNQRDHTAVTPGSSSGDFILPLETAQAAVRRELLHDFGIADEAERARYVGDIKFYYPDKENLFFYLFEQEVDVGRRFPMGAQMFPWKVGDLLAVREHQVLTNAVDVLGDERLTQAQRRRAGRLAELNLLLHGHADLAARVADEVRRRKSAPEFIDEVSEMASATRTYRYSGGRELYISGIAGLQYRAFFSHLLPVYERLGVVGATAVMDAIRSDAVRASALRELAELYVDEDTMASVPIEV